MKISKFMFIIVSLASVSSVFAQPSGPQTVTAAPGATGSPGICPYWDPSVPKPEWSDTLVFQFGGGASFTGQTSLSLTNQDIQNGAANAISFIIQSWLRNSHPRIDNTSFSFVYDPNVFSVYGTQTAYTPNSLNPVDGTRLTSLTTDGSGQYGYCGQGQQVATNTPSGGYQQYPGCNVSVAAEGWPAFRGARPSTANSQVASIAFSVKPGYENYITNMESKIELIDYGFNASAIGIYDVENSDLWSEVIYGAQVPRVPSCSTLTIRFPIVPNLNQNKATHRRDRTKQGGVKSQRKSRDNSPSRKKIRKKPGE